MYCFTLLTSREVDISDLYQALNSDGIGDISQKSPQYIYRCCICGVDLNINQVLIEHWWN